MNKRKRNDSDTKSSKRYKKDKIDPNNYDYKIDDTWVPISKTRNGSLKDYCLDWFDMYNIKNIDDKPVKKSFKSEHKDEKDSFLSFILSKGSEFEKYIINILKNKFPNDFIQIAESYEAKDISKYKDTLLAMKENIPIIYQGILHNTQNKTYGSVDLIIRTDYLRKIFNHFPTIEEEDNDKKEINDEKIENIYDFSSFKYKYCVIDIKWSQLHFNADGLTLRNTANVKPFKTQIILYNIALGEAFNRIYSNEGLKDNIKYPNYCYLLGKSWILERTVNKKKEISFSNNPFDKLGIVDISDNDNKYIETINDILEWYRKLNLHGHKWSVNPPSNKYLYPNMSNTLDGLYHKLKMEIANKFFEITNIWQCGVNHRENAMNQNFFSWKHKDVDAKLLGINGKYTQNLVDKILQVNRGEYKDIIYPKKFKNNDGNWKFTKIKLYIDIETIPGIFFNDEKNDEKNNEREFRDIIFMIGLGIRQNDEYKVEKFILEDLTIEKRKEMMNKFLQRLKDFTSTPHGKDINKVPLFHYGHYDKNIYNKTCDFLNIKYSSAKEGFKFIDLNKILKQESFVIKGALNYSLKSIIKAMNINGLTDLDYSNENDLNIKITRGEDCMYQAWKYYTKDRNENIMKLIDLYNDIDCKGLDELMMKIMMKRK